MNLILELMGWAGTELGREFCDCKEGGGGGGSFDFWGPKRARLLLDLGAGDWGLGLGWS